MLTGVTIGSKQGKGQGAAARGCGGLFVRFYEVGFAALVCWFGGRLGL